MVFIRILLSRMVRDFFSLVNYKDVALFVDSLRILILPVMCASLRQQVSIYPTPHSCPRTQSKWCVLLFVLFREATVQTSRRLFDAIVAGCLPILISDDIDAHLPFSEAIPYEDFLVRVPEKVWNRDPKAVLQSLREVQVEDMRARRAAMALYAPLLDWQNGDRVFKEVINCVLSYNFESSNSETGVIQRRRFASWGNNGKFDNPKWRSEWVVEPRFDRSALQDEGLTAQPMECGINFLRVSANVHYETIKISKYKIR